MKSFTPILAIIAAAAGCVPSLHPILTDKDVVFDEALLGKWERIDKDGMKETWNFTKGEANSYRLAHTDTKGHSANLDAHLGKLGDATFLSIHPDRKGVTNVNSLYQIYSIPTYGFFVVHSLKPDLGIISMNPGWLKEYLKNKPDALAHELVDDAVIITADTVDLQRFASEHIKTPNAYGEPYVLKRSE